MKKFIILFSLIFSINLFATEAPDFELESHNKKTVRLSDLKGEIVVLEWFNKGCPFVKKFYEAKKMQELQQKFTGLGVKWLTIISSAKDKQGHETTIEATKTREEWQIKSSHTLLDPTGKVGKLYGAKTTPHFFIISKDQKIVYQGAIDSIPSGDPADIPQAKNYIAENLSKLVKNQKVSIDRTKPYGCSVKYQ